MSETLTETVTEAKETLSIAEPQEVIGQINNFGELIFDALLLMGGAMLIIVLLYRLVNRFVILQGKYDRALKVTFGASYVMILVMAILLALRSVGYDVSGIAGLALLTVIVGAVLIFLLLPFLPVLPFKIGHMIQVGTVVGVVDNITTYHTMIRTFDGQIVFIPNAVIFASTIINFHHTPNRRVDLSALLTPDCNLSKAKDTLLELMNAETAVLHDPAPSAFITDLQGEGAKIDAYCWVANVDWFGTRDSLYLKLIERLGSQSDIKLAVPRREVRLTDAAGGSRISAAK